MYPWKCRNLRGLEMGLEVVSWNGYMACSAKGEEVALHAKGWWQGAQSLLCYRRLWVLKLAMSQAGETGNFWGERRPWTQRCHLQLRKFLCCKLREYSRKLFSHCLVWCGFFAPFFLLLQLVSMVCHERQHTVLDRFLNCPHGYSCVYLFSYLRT